MSFIVFSAFVECNRDVPCISYLLYPIPFLAERNWEIIVVYERNAFVLVVSLCLKSDVSLFLVLQVFRVSGICAHKNVSAAVFTVSVSVADVASILCSFEIFMRYSYLLRCTSSSSNSSCLFFRLLVELCE